MKRQLLRSTVLVPVLLLAGHAHAACITTPASGGQPARMSCTGSVTGPVGSAEEQLDVTIASGASITSGTTSSAITFSPNYGRIQNHGSIVSADGGTGTAVSSVVYADGNLTTGMLDIFSSIASGLSEAAVVVVSEEQATLMNHADGIVQDNGHQSVYLEGQFAEIINFSNGSQVEALRTAIDAAEAAGDEDAGPGPQDLFNLFLTGNSDATDAGSISGGDINLAGEETGLFNLGTIAADIAMYASNGGVEIFNAGEINGSVSVDGNALGNLNNPDAEGTLVMNTGTMGDLSLEVEGADVYNLVQSAELQPFFDLLFSDEEQDPADFGEQVRHLMTADIDGQAGAITDGVLSHTVWGSNILNMGTIANGVGVLQDSNDGYSEIYNSANATITGGVIAVGYDIVDVDGGDGEDAGIEIQNMGQIADGISITGMDAEILNLADVPELTANFFGDNGVSASEEQALLRASTVGASHGVISGGIEMNSANRLMVANLGEINGDIQMNAADDRFYNNGTVNGNVFLGDGDDFASLGSSSIITGVLDGGAGDNTLNLFGSVVYDADSYLNFQNIIFDTRPGETAEVQLDDEPVDVNMTIGAGQTLVADDDGEIEIADGRTFTVTDGATIEAETIIGGDGSEIAIEQGGEFPTNLEGFDTVALNPGEGELLNLTGDVQTDGDVVVESGQVAINGTFGGDGAQLDVGEDATLKGAGEITADIEVAGTHAPGNSPGTQTITGDYALSGTLEIEATPSAADRVNVDGNVTLNNGSTIQAAVAEGTYQRTTTYTFLSYTGTLTNLGAMEDVSNVPSYLTADFDLTDDGNLELTLTRLGTDLSSNAAIRSDFAAAFDALSASSTDAGVLQATEGMFATGNPLLQNVAELSGQAAANHTVSNVNNVMGFVGASGAGQSAVRQGVARGDLAFLSAVEGIQLASASLMSDAGDGIQYLKPSKILWMRAVGSKGETDPSGSYNDSNYHTYGSTFGVTKPLENGYSIGANVGYLRSQTNGARSDDETQYDALQAAVTAGKTTSFGTDVDLTLGYAYNTAEQTRRLTVGAFSGLASASYDVHQGFAQAAVGHTVKAGWLNVRPSASATYIAEQRGAYDEEGVGALGLSVDSETYQRGVLQADLEFATLSKLADGGTIRPSARVGAQHIVGDYDGQQTATFLGGGNSFTVNGAEIERTSLIGGAGLAYQVNNTVQAGVDYQARVNDELMENTVSGNLRVRW